MYNKIISLLTSIVLITSFSITAFADTYTEEIKTDVPPNIVFLGDSIATGFGLQGYESGKDSCNSYANQLYDKYSAALKNKCETSKKNFAVDGYTSTMLLEELKGNTYNSALKNADAVVVSIGGNDLLSILWELLSNFGYSSDEYDGNFSIKGIWDSFSQIDTRIDNALYTFEKNLKEITSTIHQKSDAVIIIQTLYNPFNEIFQIPKLQTYTEEKITALNDCIFSHKDDTKAEYLVADVYSRFVGKGSKLTNMSDMDFHPNQDGHNIIADCVDKTIRQGHYTYTKEAYMKSEKTSDNENVITSVGLIFIGTLIMIMAAIAFITMKLKKTKKEENKDDNISDRF